MSDVKRLLDEATPLPWKWDGRGKGYIRGERRTVADMRYRNGENDAPLIVAAVNRLPDYEAAVDALEVLAAESEWIRDHPSNAARHPDERTINAARAALRRLRDEVPA